MGVLAYSDADSVIGLRVPCRPAGRRSRFGRGMEAPRRLSAQPARRRGPDTGRSLQDRTAAAGPAPAGPTGRTPAQGRGRSGTVGRVTQASSVATERHQCRADAAGSASTPVGPMSRHSDLADAVLAYARLPIVSTLKPVS